MLPARVHERTRRCGRDAVRVTRAARLRPRGRGRRGRQFGASGAAAAASRPVRRSNDRGGAGQPVATRSECENGG